MENQINVGDQNTQQIGQNPTTQPPVTPVPEKPKVNYWMISTIALAISLFVFFVWFYFNKANNNGSSNQTSQFPTPSTSVSTTPVSLETINLNTQSTSDSITELFFSENNAVYSTKNEGLVKKLSSLDGNITNILFLPGKKDLLVVTENPETQKEIYDQATNKMIPVVDSHTAYWILKGDTQKVEKFPYTLYEPSPLRDIEEMTNFEQISTKENLSGGADILLDKLDGGKPIKIGFLKEKPLERQTCEIGNNCTEKYYPSFFIPSFDESYLLSRSPRGGGLGESAIIVSKDGSKQYKIDFYWYVSAAAWIDNNKLLAQDQKGAKIFTFNSDGTFATTNIPNNIVDQFNQRTLSPNKKYVGVITYNPNYEVSLFDVNTFQKKSVETVKHGSTDPNAIRIIGWSNDSNKMLYVVGDMAKIYELSTNKTNVVASLKNGAPNWVKVNRLSFAQNIFEIR